MNLTDRDRDVMAAVTRFWSMVQVGQPDACWPWLGHSEKGYGRFFFDGQMVGAHELCLTFTTGEERAEVLDSCHCCNNPICCNPRHVRFDTRASNIADMVVAGTHRNGAKLTAEDVVVIRTRHAHGASGRSIALDYSVSEAAVNMIVTGKRWANVGGPIRTAHGNRRHGRYAHGR